MENNLNQKKTSLTKSFIKNKDLILYLTKNDFKKKFAGSAFGIVWAFTQPLVTVVLYWFIFQVGFRSGSANGYPFVLYLLGGLVPWFYFQEAIQSTTNCFQEYSYLVKKVVFDIEILPVIKLLSSMFVHFFFIFVIFIVMMLNGMMPTLGCLQFIYYTFALFMFLYGLTYLTSSLNVFFSDLGQLISTFLQALMWFTPILWNFDQQFLGLGKLRVIFKLNPLFYIVQGYRSVLFEGGAITDHLGLMAYFWAVTLFLILVGSKVFKKLRPHFSDVL